MSGPIWKVIGGGDKGGIVVRAGKDVESALEPNRLTTGALIKELEQEGERVHYELLVGGGPQKGWVSTKLQSGKELLAKASDIWEVVGGADKGGIVVRTGKDVSSPQTTNRLSTGALVQQLELESDRLQFQRVTGSGPATGWVSTKIAGKDLLVIVGQAATNGGTHPDGLFPQLTCQTDVKAPALAQDVEAELAVSLESFFTDYCERLMSGKIVGPIDTLVQRMMEGNDPKGSAPGRISSEDPNLDPDFETRRKEAEQFRDQLCERVDKGITAPPPYIRLAKPNLLKMAPQMLKGDMYGLPVPPTLGDVEKLGAEWLTTAFRAAGTIGPDNAVSKVVEFRRLPTTTKDAKGGAGPKAILTVEYAQPDTGLHTKIFIKMPWAVEGESKEMGVDIQNRGGGGDDYMEQAVYRFMGPLFPFKVPKYYFADVCRENTNSILITEAVDFGSKGQISFKPYETLPLCEKYFDFQLDPHMQVEVYYCLMKAQARLAAWYQLGVFDKVPQGALAHGNLAPVGTFPWPPKLNEKQREARKRSSKLMVDMWAEYLGTYGKKCYPPELVEKQFVTEILTCVEDVCAYDNDVRSYFNLYPEYIALQHPNLNADNAYFWRNSSGGMDCGIFDWGGAGVINVIQLMTGSLTGAEGHVQDEHDVHWLQCFRDEYHKECGIKLNLGEMKRQWHLTYGVYLEYLAMRLRDAVFVQTPKQEWETITSLWDKRAIEKWNVRCYTFMIGLAIRYLHIRWVRGGRKRLHIHDAFLEWKNFFEKQGMT